jgi:hypothetical protein
VQPSGTMDTLGQFQDDFVHALFASDSVPSKRIATLTAQPAFAVYRNTVMKGCIDALQANYPAVLRLVGEEWFRAAAAIHVRAALPSDPTLLRYGADFASFLMEFTPAREFPYLPAVARLDWLWTESHAARDEASLDPATVAKLAPDVLASTVLHPHATARWAWFTDAPIYTIWTRNRIGNQLDGDFNWNPEGALLVRPRDTVEWMPLDAAGCAFLDTCAKGGALADAAAAALEVNGKTDLAQLMSTMLTAGALSGMSLAKQ